MTGRKSRMAVCLAGWLLAPLQDVGMQEVGRGTLGLGYDLGLTGIGSSEDDAASLALSCVVRGPQPKLLARRGCPARQAIPVRIARRGGVMYDASPLPAHRACLLLSMPRCGSERPTGGRGTGCRPRCTSARDGKQHDRRAQLTNAPPRAQLTNAPRAIGLAQGRALRAGAAG